MDELHQYDSSSGRGCGGGGPIMFGRRGKRSACWMYYWPSFSGGRSSKEVFDVSSSFCLWILLLLLLNGN